MHEDASERDLAPVVHLHAWPKCQCGARAVNDDFLERHKQRGYCLGTAGRLLKQRHSGAPRPEGAAGLTIYQRNRRAA